MNTDQVLIEIKEIIQDCHINFILGSGASMPFLSTLGNIEDLLTLLAIKKEEGTISTEQNKIIQVSLYKKYFDEVILKNLDILSNSELSKNVLNYYKVLLIELNSLLLNRKNPILNKKINLFTTNIDVFLEKSLESTTVEFNDGFSGRFNPIFNISNFNKSYSRTSLHYDNKSELPVFNLIKLHGSLTWDKTEDEIICFSSDLRNISTIKKVKIPPQNLLRIDEKSTIEELLTLSSQKKYTPTLDTFIGKYEKLAIVNPTKEKFKETILNRNYYDLLRIYSNELEKENSVLFVLGFSFSDEHIRDLTRMAADSNPTLKIFIFSHSNEISKGIQLIQNKSKNNNIIIICPPQKEDQNGNLVDEFKYDLNNFTQKIIHEISNQVNQNDEKLRT